MLLQRVGALGQEGLQKPAKLMQPVEIDVVDVLGQLQVEATAADRPHDGDRCLLHGVRAAE